MKSWFAAALLSGLSVLAAPAARAQASGPAFPAPASVDERISSGNADGLARNQRRAAMTPDEVKRDQQLALLEARTGNTSFTRSGAPERQFDSSRGGFIVRKFKDRPGTAKQRRGLSHPIGAGNPEGKPLVHKSQRKRKFLFF